MCPIQSDLFEEFDQTIASNTTHTVTPQSSHVKRPARSSMNKGKPRKFVMAVTDKASGKALISRQLTFQEVVELVGRDNYQEKIRAALQTGELERILVHENANSEKRSVRYIQKARTIDIFS